MINIIYCRNAHVSASPDSVASAASYSARLEGTSPTLISMPVVCTDFLFQGNCVCLMGQPVHKILLRIMNFLLVNTLKM